MLNFCSKVTLNINMRQTQGKLYLDTHFERGKKKLDQNLKHWGNYIKNCVIIPFKYSLSLQNNSWQYVWLFQT